MKKMCGAFFLLLGCILSLAGCSDIGAKSANASMVYCVTTVLSVLVIAAYLTLIRKKNLWFLLLFSSVFVVNTGYLTLSLSTTLAGALHANRLAYLGSVVLPSAMLMILLNTCKLSYPKILPWGLLVTGAGVLVVAASPGYLDIYYKEVSLSTVNGMTVLEKVYGPWHCLYLFYLLAYFGATTGVLLYAAFKKNMDSVIHAVFMGTAVFVNMGVWLLEQLVRIDFELLSVSYIISELFLLLLCRMLQDDERRDREDTGAPASKPVGLCPDASIPHPDPQKNSMENPNSRTYDGRLEYFSAQRSTLTPTEKTIYRLYLDGKTTKEILAELNIKENTLKFHNKNIYGKLGVSSRRELQEMAAALSDKGFAS